jgi:ABC-type oligopeptide transport system ATPase subunit
MDKLLKVENLVKHFKRESIFGQSGEVVTAVDDVSFSIGKGKILAIVGESGSGKTTVARCIAAIEKPDSGAITFEDAPLVFDTVKKRGAIQYVFQDTFGSLNPRMKIAGIIAEPIAFHFCLKGRELSAETAKYLKDVGLSAEIGAKYPHELSGGQRQRVVIARALATKPKLLIADEPVSSLDVSVQAQILSLFSGLNKENNISIIFITHDLRVVKSLADDIIIMNCGKIVEYGDVKTVYANPQSSYTKLLLSSIPGSHRVY